MKMSVLLVLLFLNIAFAGDERGNGGDGVLYGEEVLLFDFVESGIEHDLYFQDDYLPRILSELYTIPGLKKLGLDLNLLAKKLTFVFSLKPILGFHLIQALRMHDWHLVDRDLVNIQDDQSVVQFGQELVQLAVRKDRSIKIAKKYWLRTPKEHKVGLIFHEILYSVIKATAQEVRALTSSFFDAQSTHVSILRYLAAVYPVPEELTGGAIEISSNSVRGKSFFQMQFPSGNTWRSQNFNGDEINAVCHELKIKKMATIIIVRPLYKVKFVRGNAYTYKSFPNLVLYQTGEVYENVFQKAEFLKQCED